MYPSIVEEVKVDVLYKKSSRIPADQLHPPLLSKYSQTLKHPKRNQNAKFTWCGRPCAGWRLVEESPESECCWQQWWSCTASLAPSGLNCQSQPQMEDGPHYVQSLSRHSPTAKGKDKDFTFSPYFNADLSGFTVCTHHYWIIVSTSDSENHSCSLISDPAGRHHHLPLIPHPANEVSQSRVLCDVIVAGRNRHVNHWARLHKTKVTTWHCSFVLCKHMITVVIDRM